MKNCTLRNWISTRFSTAIVTFLVILAVGCTSTKKTKQTESGTGNGPVKASAADAGSDIDLNCVMDHIQNPTEAFHYSYLKQSSNPVEEQADITPQIIDGMFKNNSATRTLHGDRSDPESWHTAWAGLMGIGGMSSAIALVKNSSATVKEGHEKINGYDAVKYSIDTARGTPIEQGLYRSVLGAGGFEKGTVWTIRHGCPVKLVLDSELHLNNGNIEKLHYEEAMVRKGL
jgi:hypothetical protein